MSVTRTSVVAAKDAWLARKVGGSTNYGNGTTQKITVGPSSSASATYKGRGVFEIHLYNVANGTDLLADLVSLSAASLKIQVADEACAVRGATQRIFLEQLTGDFSENGAAGNCTISTSGTADQKWPGPSSITTQRVLFTASAPATNTVISVDILTMMQAALANGTIIFRFRLIAANAAGDGYDESNTARTISFKSSKNVGAEPYISVTGDVASATAKTMSLAMNMQLALTVSGSSTFSVDGEKALAKLTQQNQSTTALLNSVSTRDVETDSLFALDKKPTGDTTDYAVIARGVDKDNCYKAIFRINPSGVVGLYLQKRVSGTPTTLASIADIGLSFSANTQYHLKMSAIGATPTVLRAKVWRHGLAEPSWQITAQDSQVALQVAEAVGMALAAAVVTNLPLTYSVDEFNTIAGV